MRRHLHRWLNDSALRELGDQYEGRIASVTEESIRNRFTAQRQLEPVITFEEGWRLVPNITQRRTLVDLFGTNTDDWLGHRLVVYRMRSEKTDPKTGLVRECWEKRVMLPTPLNMRRRA